MARIVFTDSIGTATLDNGLGTAGGGFGARFAGWTPFTQPVGPARTALGTGARYKFAFRTDRGARFRLEEIPATHLAVAIRLMAHLENGGTVRVDTDDAQARVYTSCGLAPESEPMLEPADRRRLTYTLSLALINLGTTDDMLCEYGGFGVVDDVILLAGPDRLPGLTFTRASTAAYATPG